jgi:hypothetical protein
LLLALSECSSAQVSLEWVKPGSYAVYNLAASFLVKRNNEYWDVSSEEAIVQYGFEILEVDGKYALLRVWLNESTILPQIFGNSSLSCLVWVDLETNDLVDRETGEAWGKCVFWVSPSDVDKKGVVAVKDFFGMSIAWDNYTIVAERARSLGYKEPSIHGESPIGSFTNFDIIQALVGYKEDMTITINTSWSYVDGRINEGHGYIQFPLWFITYDYHVEKGLLLFAGPYTDDILIKKFGIMFFMGSLYYTRPEYTSGEWYAPTMAIYDTNIVKGREESESWSPMPLAIAMVAAIPIFYYIGLRRWLKRS